MTPTIRIDQDVYAWLQKKARPFEDTPNSVLRRIAGIDEPIEESSLQITESVSSPLSRPGKSINPGQPQSGKIRTMPRRVNGEILNKEWKVGARHALYHKDGTFYENLERFPGALFDPDGYILFKTEEDYRHCKYFIITEKTNAHRGIHSIPGYIRVNRKT
jgi:hypothetical protein